MRTSDGLHGGKRKRAVYWTIHNRCSKTKYCLHERHIVDDCDTVSLALTWLREVNASGLPQLVLVLSPLGIEKD